MNKKSIKLHHVKWEIEIEAETPEDAAKLALDMQMDRNSVATVFQVSSNCLFDLEDYKIQKRKDMDNQDECFCCSHSIF